MTNEEKILQMLGSVQNRLDQMQDKMEQMQTRMEDGFSKVDERLDALETQQRENTDIIKALLHNQEHFNAELAALKLYTASAESVRKLDTKFNLLNARVFECETSLGELQLRKSS